MKWMSILLIHVVIMVGLLNSAQAQSSSRQNSSEYRVGSLQVTILSTMLADGPGLGGWGFAALIEVDGHRLLFDTGIVIGSGYTETKRMTLMK